MTPQVQRLHDDVTGHERFCVSVADRPEAVRERAAQGGFPVDVVPAVAHTIDPARAEVPVPA